MGYTGINLENVKVSNRSAILKLLNDHGAMSRKDIALELGLTPATVTLICTELISAGLLCEKGEVEEKKRAGRKKVLIGINYQYRNVLSISIEASETCVTVSDLRGCRYASRRIATDGSADPGQFLKMIANESKALMWESGISRESVLGVGVSVPGAVDRRAGVSNRAYRIWNEPVRVAEILRQYLDYPVIVENNVKAFAEGELIYGIGKQQDNLLFLKWGPGVGSAIIIHNKIYDSRNSKAAEIGHYIVEKNGARCRCGRRGCLETRVSTHAIAEQVAKVFDEERTPQLYRLAGGDKGYIGARNIANWTAAEDTAMWKVLDELIDQLARTVVNSITLLAPDKVIIYGQLFEIPRFQEHFLNACKSYDASYDENYILKSELSDKIEYIGPLAVVVNELFLMTGSVED